LSIVSFITFCIIVMLANVVRDVRFSGQSPLFFGLFFLFGFISVWLEVGGSKVALGLRRRRKKDADDTELDT
jgi:hypothetical protein